MNVIDVFERVTLTTPISQPKFIHYFNDSVAYLVSKYRPRYVLTDDMNILEKAEDIHDTVAVMEQYADAIVDNIIYLATDNADRKTDFVSKAETTYNGIWLDVARGATMTNRCRWSRGW